MSKAFRSFPVAAGVVVEDVVEVAVVVLGAVDELVGVVEVGTPVIEVVGAVEVVAAAEVVVWV